VSHLFKHSFRDLVFPLKLDPDRASIAMHGLHDKRFELLPVYIEANQQIKDRARISGHSVNYAVTLNKAISTYNLFSNSSSSSLAYIYGLISCHPMGKLRIVDVYDLATSKPMHRLVTMVLAPARTASKNNKLRCRTTKRYSFNAKTDEEKLHIKNQNSKVAYLFHTINNV
jgi:hypothetical protein